MKRLYSLQASAGRTKNVKKYQSTVFLPKTDFPGFLKPEEVVERDERIQKEKKFSEYYSWQRENLRGKEFVLHDGPPYANGKPHIGHAINKILKDIILRSQLIQGNRVHYKPGWDCHGLPIELIAIKDAQKSPTAVEIRGKAKEVATTMSKLQMESFKSWGVLGDWENQCYYTSDVSYVVNQLNIFWKMFEKGLIYYDLKPVFWSPSSRTALAEAELIYKIHTSSALTVRFEVAQSESSEPLYLLIWTTTPWTLPLNEAVFCGTTVKYSVVKIPSFSGSYIIATELIKTLEEKIKTSVTILKDISCEELIKLKYKHPWKPNEIKNVFASPTVTVSGTGLLHSVPAHGHEDFLMGLANNLKLKCNVDEEGRYTAAMGPDLEGLEVLNEGSEFVSQRLSSDIIVAENYVHNYPYDWRSQKPCIIRASQQWFIDLEKLKTRAEESLKDVDVPVTYFLTNLKARPYWCLSRQRAWGVPIPAFYHKTTGRPLLSKSLINHLCVLFEAKSPDAWWSEKVETLFPKKVCEELFVKIEDVVKGEDIMDIWFDSGISWSYALDGKKSELYLEGVDQYGGWFQSSLFTSCSVKNESPFKKILTHGFAVDQDGNKMSKSLGNIVDPESVVKGDKALGVDVLRWWVGSHSNQSLISVSHKLLNSDSESLQKLRLTLRFLLGALKNSLEEDLEKCNELEIIDKYVLNSCYKFYNSTIDLYNSFNIQQVCANLTYFVANNVSSRYITAIKDRLYCDEITSRRRKACLYTLNGILNTLCYSIAPILPHLAEEVFSHHPVYSNKRELFYSKSKWTPPEFWENSSFDKIMDILRDIKSELLLITTKLPQMSCLIEMDESNYNFLKEMQNGKDESMDSPLTEILQVSKVQLKMGSRKITLLPSDFFCCSRCRRYIASSKDELCTRCDSVVSQMVLSSGEGEQNYEDSNSDLNS